MDHQEHEYMFTVRNLREEPYCNRMAKTSRIFLTGFMGCGKTVVGQILASILLKEFIDLDKTIEDLHNETIEQIFAQRGEASFRQMETSSLVTIPHNVVCALGVEHC